VEKLPVGRKMQDEIRPYFIGSATVSIRYGCGPFRGETTLTPRHGNRPVQALMSGQGRD